MTNTTLSQEQNIAANPFNNVWVQANAGTGKTTVLIQRLIRILFWSIKTKSYNVGILCLTFTNVAASEMKTRILKELQKIATKQDSELIKTLEIITDDFDNADLEILKNMFYYYIDNQEILKIKTIHGFCEEILKSFPGEAGIPYNWSILNDTDKEELLQKAFNNAILYAPKTSELFRSFEHLTTIISEYSLTDFFELIKTRYSIFFNINDIVKYKAQFIEKIRNILNIDNNEVFELSKNELRNILKNVVMLQNTKKSPTNRLTKIVEDTKQYIENTINFEKYKENFLTREDEINKTIKDELLQNIANDIYIINKNIKTKELYENTITLFNLSYAFYEEYRKIKLKLGVLDYDDLILYTKKLLNNPKHMGFVLSQLDYSIKHILVDEAQDTSSYQWEIIYLLINDFFSSSSNSFNNHKSLFVVGDIKQSIFSFQGAVPELFIASRDKINKTININKHKIKNIDLNTNFRSCKTILEAVDKIFNNQNIQKFSKIKNVFHKYVIEDNNTKLVLEPLSTENLQ